MAGISRSYKNVPVALPGIFRPRGRAAGRLLMEIRESTANTGEDYGNGNNVPIRLDVTRVTYMSFPGKYLNCVRPTPGGVSGYGCQRGC